MSFRLYIGAFIQSLHFGALGLAWEVLGSQKIVERFGELGELEITDS